MKEKVEGRRERERKRSEVKESEQGDGCGSRGFIGGGQTFKFLFDAPPRKPLLWHCLLVGASRDLYPEGFDSPKLQSHIPYAAGVERIAVERL